MLNVIPNIFTVKDFFIKCERNIFICNSNALTKWAKLNKKIKEKESKEIFPRVLFC